MLIFKFGGASVKSADAVKNIVSILKGYTDSIIVVVSAMGKTTNLLEKIIESYVKKDEKLVKDKYKQLKENHLEIIDNLFPDRGNKVFVEINDVFEELADRLIQEPTMNFDYDYDQIIGYGEILSTTIISHYLSEAGLKSRWMDIRKSLKTDSTFREGRIDWKLSSDLATENFSFVSERILVTQGFLASNLNNQTVSLGREGSDYTAAILAYLLKAKSVTIWKDVPGVLNADPKYFDDTILLEKLSYLDAIELAYYGTSVIHPKTIKPLQNKNIPLYVKSFVDPKAPGTVVGSFSYKKLVPSFIFKMNQVLIRISPLDFSFIAEDNLEKIYGILHRHGQ